MKPGILLLAQSDSTIIAAIIAAIVSLIVSLLIAAFGRRTELSKFRQSHRVTSIFTAAESLSMWWRFQGGLFGGAMAICRARGDEESKRHYLAAREAIAAEGAGQYNRALAYLRLLGFRSAADQLESLRRLAISIAEDVWHGAQTPGGSIPAAESVHARIEEARTKYLLVFDLLERALDAEYRDRRDSLVRWLREPTIDAAREEIAAAGDQSQAGTSSRD